MKLIILVIGLLLCDQIEAKQKFYKWTDADGNTHYSQEKPKDQKTDEINVDNSPPPEVVVTNTTKEKVSNNRLTTEQKITEHYKKKEEAKKTAKKSKKGCIAAKKNLKKFQQAEPFRRQDPKTGKYTYLEDKDRAQMIKGLKQVIKKLCK